MVKDDIGTPLLLVKLSQKQGLTQEALADLMNASVKQISKWWRGEARPRPAMAFRLAQYFGVNDPALLFLPASDTEPLEQDSIMDFLSKLDRRALLAMLQTLPAFAGVDLSVLDNTRIIADEDFLSSCNASIAANWHLLRHDGMSHADNILTSCISKLSDLATHPSDMQEMAASIATEAKIQQIIIATHKLNYRTRGLCALGAVHFGKLSGDSRIHAVAISWQADMYTSAWNRSPQPGKAIALYKEGLASLDDMAFLNRADLSIGLAKAYALSGDETHAIEMIEQAKTVIPEQPEQDTLYQMSEFGKAELDQQEGRIYLELDRFFPDQDYAQLAYNVFNQNAGNQYLSDRARSQRLILKADAARGINDFHVFVECLEQGLVIAQEINSLKRKSEAKRVLVKAPECWKNEDTYQQLVKMF